MSSDEAESIYPNELEPRQNNDGSNHNFEISQPLDFRIAQDGDNSGCGYTNDGRIDNYSACAEARQNGQ